MKDIKIAGELHLCSRVEFVDNLLRALFPLLGYGNPSDFLMPIIFPKFTFVKFSTEGIRGAERFSKAVRKYGRENTSR
jgi:hypothetical protein